MLVSQAHDQKQFAEKRHSRRPRHRKVSSTVFFLCIVSAFLLGYFIGAATHSPESASSEQTQAVETIDTTEAQTAPVQTSPPTEITVHPSDDWQLALVNFQNPMEFDRDIPLRQLSNGLSVDARCYAALMDMLESCRDAGLSPIVCSAYRSMEDQQRLYTAKIDAFIGKGFSETEAKEQAGQLVAVPGTSEHHLGLAVDIVDADYQLLDELQEDTAVQKWLMENSWRYGFILRYPGDKMTLTGITYEPWHYRYVGKEAARYIFEQGICLEEYLQTASR